MFFFFFFFFWKPEEVAQSFVFYIFPEAPYNDNIKAVQFADHVVNTYIAHGSKRTTNGYESFHSQFGDKPSNFFSKKINIFIWLTEEVHFGSSNL